MNLYLAVSKHLTSASLAILSGVMGWRYAHGDNVFIPSQEEIFTLTVNETELTFLTIGFFITAITIQIFCYRFPLRIYRNDNNYIAIFEGYLPGKKSTYNFEKGEVSALPPTGVLPWRDSRFKMKNRTVIMLENNFKTPSELSNMMSRRRRNTSN